MAESVSRLQLPSKERVLPFPTFTREEWLSLDAALTWDQAAARLKVSRSALRRALDSARATAGPDPLNLEGICNGQRFHAERPRARRGVAWRFYLHRDTRTTAVRMNGLRENVQFQGAAPRLSFLRHWRRPRLGRVLWWRQAG
jgi:hypothetical protein